MVGWFDLADNAIVDNHSLIANGVVVTKVNNVDACEGDACQAGLADRCENEDTGEE